MRNFIAITGTGRAGTTFLVELLTNLGLDTGYTPGRFRIARVANAGLEWRPPTLPTSFIAKSPMLCDFVDDVVALGGRIEHAIVPVRNFADAAASRIRVQRALTGSCNGTQLVAGGLWDTSEAERQERVLREKFARLVEALVRHDVPTTFLAFPRLIADPAYLYAKLKFLLGNISPADFRAAFQALVRPEWVHSFGRS